MLLISFGIKSPSSYSGGKGDGASDFLFSFFMLVDRLGIGVGTVLVRLRDDDEPFEVYGGGAGSGFGSSISSGRGGSFSFLASSILMPGGSLR